MKLVILISLLLPALSIASDFTTKSYTISKGQRLSIIKVNVNKVDFRLIAYGRDNKTATEQDSLRKYLRKFQYNSLINASMFKKDYLTSVGYMRDGAYINNPQFLDKYGALIVFNPKVKGIKKFDILEKTNLNNWKTIIKDYSTVIENYRTISNGKNLWKQTRKKHTHMFQIGLDSQENLYFISFEGKSGVSISKMNDLILQLPHGITTAAYLDGGPHGIMQLKTKSQNLEFGADFKVFSPNFILLNQK